MLRREWQDLRTLSVEELESRLDDAQEELANLQFQLGSHQLENPIKVRYQRRDVARLKTLIREKKMEEAKKAVETESATAEAEE
ncbi:50S ribosomal protein L29 [bacterium]|nr:50S ribosomal protein L29 [bacterium]